MIKGGYRKGRKKMPRVLRLSVAVPGSLADSGPWPGRAGPPPDGPVDCLVTLHEEGTGISWRRNATVPAATTRALVGARDTLAWAGPAGKTPPEDRRAHALDLGRMLRDAVLGDDGVRYLERISVTACLLDVDGPLRWFPWELLPFRDEPIAEVAPTGRIITTTTVPAAPPEPIEDGQPVRILAVRWPRDDPQQGGEGGGECDGPWRDDLDAVLSLDDWFGGVPIEITTLRGADATRERLRSLVAETPFHVLHFAGGGAVDVAPASLSAADVAALPLAAPPHVVFDGTPRAAGEAEEVAAAFAQVGASAWIGHSRPPSPAGAALLAGVFFRALFTEQNVGAAALMARWRAVHELDSSQDASGLGLVLYGDAASAHRRDLETAA